MTTLNPIDLAHLRAALTNGKWYAEKAGDQRSVSQIDTCIRKIDGWQQAEAEQAYKSGYGFSDSDRAEMDRLQRHD